MLEALVGSPTAERVLLFLAARERGYAREIAEAFDVAPSQVQRVMERMERDGLLVAQNVGRTRVYEFNPRFLFRDKIVSLFREVLAYYPEEFQIRIKKNRRRPRRKGKSL